MRKSNFHAAKVFASSLLVLVGTREARAVERTRRRVQPRLETFPVNVCGQGRHILEAVVGTNDSLRVARRTAQFRFRCARLHRPAVVDIHVLIAEVGHAGRNHHIGRLPHLLAGRVSVIGVPGVPAHGRSERQRLAHHDAEEPHRLSFRISRQQRDGIDAGLVRCNAGDDAGAGIEAERRRQTLGGKMNGTHAGAGNAVKKQVARPRAVNRGAVDFGCGGRFGSEYRTGVVCAAELGR